MYVYSEKTVKLVNTFIRKNFIISFCGNTAPIERKERKKEM
jgi:hypothetical protein